MRADLLMSENLTSEELHAIFDAAMLEVKLDDDGDVVVYDKYRVFVAPHGDKYVRFLTFFRVKEEAEEEAGYALCNRINDNLIVIRASINNATTLAIDWYIPVAGGISKKAVVRALRVFIELVGEMGKYDTDDIIM